MVWDREVQSGHGGPGCAAGFWLSGLTKAPGREPLSESSLPYSHQALHSYLSLCIKYTECKCFAEAHIIHDGLLFVKISPTYAKNVESYFLSLFGILAELSQTFIDSPLSSISFECSHCLDAFGFILFLGRIRHF